MILKVCVLETFFMFLLSEYFELSSFYFCLMFAASFWIVGGGARRTHEH